MLNTLWNRPVRFTAAPWSSLLHDLDSMFDAIQNAPRTSAEHGEATFTPSIEVDEDKERYLLTFEIPGVRKDDLNIELTGNRLVVSGERKSVNKTSRRHGKFQQVFTVPEGVNAEGIEADCRDGVLTMTIQKPSVARATKIKIGDSAGKPGFIKNLIGEKKAKDVEVRQTRDDHEPAAMAN